MFPVTEDSRRSNGALVSPLLTYFEGKNRVRMVAGRDHELDPTEKAWRLKLSINMREIRTSPFYFADIFPPSIIRNHETSQQK